jgi:hypothetical protein
VIGSLCKSRHIVERSSIFNLYRFFARKYHHRLRRAGNMAVFYLQNRQKTIVVRVEEIGETFAKNAGAVGLLRMLMKFVTTASKHKRR